MGKAFALALKKWRANAGITQADLAKALGYGPSSVGHWEQGCSHPSTDVHGKIISTLGISTREFKRAINDDLEIIDGSRVALDTTSCNNCPKKRQAECRRIVYAGLPVLCETITRDDVLSAQARGVYDDLMARYGDAKVLHVHL